MEKLFPLEKIIETENFDVHQDWETPIVTFFIVASKDKSKRSISDFGENELKELIGLVRNVRLAMEKVLAVKDVYLFQNEDTEHGFHIWLFPRHKWMEKFGRKIQSVRPIIQFSRENKITDADILEVKNAVTRVRSYLLK